MEDAIIPYIEPDSQVQQVEARRTHRIYDNMQIINKPKNTNFPTGIFMDYLA